MISTFNFITRMSLSTAQTPAFQEVLTQLDFQNTAVIGSFPYQKLWLDVFRLISFSCHDSDGHDVFTHAIFIVFCSHVRKLSNFIF